MNLNFYSIEDPKLNELVIVQFIEKGESFLKANLLEYPYKGLINFQNAKKIKAVIKINAKKAPLVNKKNNELEIIKIKEYNSISLVLPLYLNK